MWYNFYDTLLGIVSEICLIRGGVFVKLKLKRTAAKPKASDY